MWIKKRVFTVGITALWSSAVYNHLSSQTFLYSLAPLSYITTGKALTWRRKKAEHGRTGAFELWCWRRLLESPLDCKEIKLVNCQGNESLIFIGRTDAEAETPVLWLPDAKSQLIRKDPDAGKDYRQEEKRTTEDEMVGWHHWLNGHEFEWTPGVEDGQRGLACCDSWDGKELDTTERLNKNKSLISRDLVVFCVWEDASVQACRNHFFPVHLAIWGQSCFLHCSHTNSLFTLRDGHLSHPPCSSAPTRRK